MAYRYFEGTQHAALYAKFRPSAPSSLVPSMISYLREKNPKKTLDVAVDIGCGSGQSTQILSSYFNSVFGLDISKSQIDEANKMETLKNVQYKVSGAVQLPFADSSVTVVTAGQAAHWFDLPVFYKEVDRVLVPGGILALYGYMFPKPQVDGKTDQLYNLINELYSKTLSEFVLEQSRETYLGQYKADRFNIPFTNNCRDDSHYVDKSATVADLTGYISTWSGFQNFRKKNGDEAAHHILVDFEERFMKTLGTSSRPEDTNITLRFHYFLLMGRKSSV